MPIDFPTKSLLFDLESTESEFGKIALVECLYEKKIVIERN